MENEISLENARYTLFYRKYIYTYEGIDIETASALSFILNHKRSTGTFETFEAGYFLPLFPFRFPSRSKSKMPLAVRKRREGGGGGKKEQAVPIFFSFYPRVTGMPDRVKLFLATAAEYPGLISHPGYFFFFFSSRKEAYFSRLREAISSLFANYNTKNQIWNRISRDDNLRKDRRGGGGGGLLEIIKKRGEPGVIFIFYLAARLCNKGGGGSSGKFRENLLESYLASLPRVSAARQVYESSRPLSSATSLPRYNFRSRKRERARPPLRFRRQFCRIKWSR